MLTSNGWHKGSRSGPNGACLEVKNFDDGVHIKDSKQSDTAPQLVLEARGFAALKATVRGNGGY